MMMSKVVCKNDNSYFGKVYRWALYLEAEEMKINRDGSVSLYCKDGIICEDYKPSWAELNKALNEQM